MIENEFDIITHFSCEQRLGKYASNLCVYNLFLYRRILFMSMTMPCKYYNGFESTPTGIEKEFF